MTITKLEELLSQSENEKLDFKLEFNLDREYDSLLKSVILLVWENCFYKQPLWPYSISDRVILV